MRKKIEFGKVSSPWCSRRNNMVEVEIELKPQRFYSPETKEWRDGELEFSICGNLWNAHHTDCNECGQCLDSLQELLMETFHKTSDLWKTIYAFWEDYHCKPKSEVDPIRWIEMENIYNSL